MRGAALQEAMEAVQVLLREQWQDGLQLIKLVQVVRNWGIQVGQQLPGRHSNSVRDGKESKP